MSKDPFSKAATKIVRKFEDEVALDLFFGDAKVERLKTPEERRRALDGIISVKDGLFGLKVHAVAGAPADRALLLPADGSPGVVIKNIGAES